MGCGAEVLHDRLGLFNRPKFKGSLKPRPSAGPVSDQDPWNETIGYPQGQFPSGGNPIQVLGGVLGFPTSAGCEFGACGSTTSFQAGGTAVLGGASAACVLAEPCGAVELGAVAIYALAQTYFARKEKIQGIPRNDQLLRMCQAGRRTETPAVNYPGGKSVEQEFICGFGTFTIHELYDAKGTLRESHVRPGSPKYGL